MGYDGNNVPAAQATPQSIGRYRILRLLGLGGMARVWLCEDPSLRRQIVIKTIQVSLQKDTLLLERFLVEAQASAALNHPHIVPVHDYGQIPLNPQEILLFLVMPYLTGGSLADRIDDSERQQTLMPHQQALNYLKQAAQAIDYAHSQGIVHRDIKPGNMLLRPDNWLMLSDFGLARILSSTKNLTHAGTSMGTPDYIAPEQVQGRAVAASDNYSLGVIAYELFVGKRPFNGGTPAITTMQHLTERVPPPRSINPSLSSRIEEVLLRELSKQPEERYASAEGFVAALEEAVRQGNEPASHDRGALTKHEQPQIVPQTPLPQSQEKASNETDTSSQKAHRSLSRRMFLIGGGIGATVLAASAGSWFAIRHTVTSTPPRITQTPGATPTPDGLTLALSQQHASPVTSVRWSPEQNIFATVANDQQLLLWDGDALAQKRTSAPLQRVQLASATIAPLLAWSPDGKQLAVALSNPRSGQAAHLALYTQDLQTLTGFSAPLPLDTSTIDGITWLQNNLILVVANASDPQKQQFTAWLIDTTQPQTKPTSFTIDARLAIPSGTSNRPVVLATTAYSQRAPQNTSILTAAVSTGMLVATIQYQNGKPQWLGTPTSTEEATEWNPGTHIFPLNENIHNQSSSIFISYNGLVTGCYTTANTSTLELCSWTDQGNKNQRIPTNFTLTNLAYKSQAHSATLAAGTTDGQVIVWDLSQSTIPLGNFSSDTLKNEVIALDWSSKGDWLVASYNDRNNSILLWKTQGRGF